MTDLAQFLLARIAEDEAVAAEVQAYRAENLAPQYLSEPDRSIAPNVDVTGPDVRIGVDRFLDECEVRRRIVEAESGRRRLHDMAGAINVQSFPGNDALVIVDGNPMTVDEFEAVYTEPSPPSLTLRLLALPHAGHPDYRQEWRP